MKLKYGMKVRVNDGIGHGMVGIIKSQSYTNLDRYIEVQDLNSNTHWMSIPVESKRIIEAI